MALRAALVVAVLAVALLARPTLAAENAQDKPFGSLSLLHRQLSPVAR